MTDERLQQSGGSPALSTTVTSFIAVAGCEDCEDNSSLGLAPTRHTELWSTGFMEE